jgi:hypothetical protein
MSEFTSPVPWPEWQSRTVETLSGEPRIIPDLAGASGPQHPFVLWWAALFALSMRARYEPEGWTNDLDPDSSIYATELQTSLDTALTACPRLIAQAIEAVT